MEKFKHEERFLNMITEKTGELYSTINLNDSHGLSPQNLFDKPKFFEFMLDGIEYSSGVVYTDAIFLYDNNIYIYLSKTEPMISTFFCKIYYPVNRKKDVELFILNLKKLKKDGN